MAIVPRVNPALDVPSGPSGPRMPRLDVSSGVEPFVETLVGLAHNMIEQRRTNEIARSKIEVYKRLGMLGSDVSLGRFRIDETGASRADTPGGDFAQAPTAFEQLSKQMRDEILDNIDDGVVRDAVALEFDALQVQKMALVRNSAVKKMRDLTVAELDVNTVQFAHAFADATTENEKLSIVKAFRDNLVQAVTTGAITREEMASRVQKFNSSASKLEITTQIINARDSRVALEALGARLDDPQNFSGLSPEDRVRFELQIINEIEAAGNAEAINHVSEFIIHKQFDAAEIYARQTAFIDPDLKLRLLNRIDTARNQATASSSAAITALVRDHLTSIETTGVGIPGFSADAKSAMTPEDRAAFERREDLAFLTYSTVQSVQFAPPEEMEAALELLRPEPGSVGFATRQQAYESALNLASKRWKDRVDDPAQQAVERPDVAEQFENVEGDLTQFQRALDYRLEAQRQMGIPNRATRVLTENEAATLAGEFNATSPAERVERIRELQQTYGPHFNVVFQELVDAGVAPENKILPLVMHNPAVSQIVANTIDIPMAELKEGIEDTTISDIQADIRNELSPLAEAMARAAFAGETVTDVNMLRDTLTKVALNEFRRTGDANAAADFAATKVITDNLEIIDFDESLFYIPRQMGGVAISAERVEAMARDLLDPVTIAEFDPMLIGADRGLPEEIVRESTINSAASMGYWVTNEAGTGAYLLVPLVEGGALPLLDKNGNRFEFDFLDATNTPLPTPEPVRAFRAPFIEATNEALEPRTFDLPERDAP